MEAVDTHKKLWSENLVSTLGYSGAYPPEVYSSQWTWESSVSFAESHNSSPASFFMKTTNKQTNSVNFSQHYFTHKLTAAILVCEIQQSLKFLICLMPENQHRPWLDPTW